MHQPERANHYERDTETEGDALKELNKHSGFWRPSNERLRDFWFSSIHETNMEWHDAILLNM